MTCQLLLEVERDKLEAEEGQKGEKEQVFLVFVSFSLDLLNI